MTLNLNSNQMTLREVEEAPVEEEVLDMVVVVDVAEDQGSKMIEDLKIIKVIKMLNHLPPNLLIPNHQIPRVHFPTLGHHPQQPMQAVHFHQIALKISTISKVRCYII